MQVKPTPAREWARQSASRLGWCANTWPAVPCASVAASSNQGRTVVSHINLDRAFDEKSASEFKIGHRSIGADLSQRRSVPCHSKCHDNDVSGPDTSHGVVLQPALTCALTLLSRVARL